MAVGRMVVVGAESPPVRRIVNAMHDHRCVVTGHYDQGSSSQLANIQRIQKVGISFRPESTNLTVG